MKIMLYEISKGFSFCNTTDNFVIKSQKKYFKDTCTKIFACVEERLKVEDHLKTLGVKRNEIDGDLKIALDNLTEVNLLI